MVNLELFRITLLTQSRWLVKQANENRNTQHFPCKHDSCLANSYPSTAALRRNSMPPTEQTVTPEIDIFVDSVSKQYRGGFRRQGVQALNGVSMNIRRGEIFALLGPNGAGKTTLIKILLGIIRSSRGKAEILGMTAGDRRSRVNIGYLPEHLRVPKHHTVRTALSFYGQLSGLTPTTIRERSDALIDKVGLAGRDRESVRRFSKGMLQRLGLAQALLHEPQLLIMDEPTDGLDPVGRSHVRAILQELRDEGRTVFLNSHLLQEVELICDRVGIMNKGNLKFVGAVQELQPKGAGTVNLRLFGKREAILPLIGDASLTADNHLEDTYTASVAVASLEATDDLIDRIRSAGVGIRELKWQGSTLEDAFLSIIGDQNAMEASVL